MSGKTSIFAGPLGTGNTWIAAVSRELGLMFFSLDERERGLQHLEV